MQRLGLCCFSYPKNYLEITLRYLSSCIQPKPTTTLTCRKANVPFTKQAGFQVQKEKINHQKPIVFLLRNMSSEKCLRES